jgi:putative transposase
MRSSRCVQSMSDAYVSDFLQRNLCTTAPDQKWVTEVTGFNVNGQKSYLVASMDCHNGEVIARHMAKRPVFEMASDTLRIALSRARSASKLIIHSGHGGHDKRLPYRAVLASCGITQSMSRKGNCIDKAAIESFFGTLKIEYFHLAPLSSLDALEAGVHE